MNVYCASAIDLAVLLCWPEDRNYSPASPLADLVSRARRSRRAEGRAARKSGPRDYGGSRGTSLSSVELPRIIPTKYRRLRIDT